MIITIENSISKTFINPFLIKFWSLFLLKNMCFAHYAKFSSKIILNILTQLVMQSMLELPITQILTLSFLKWEKSNNFDPELSTERNLKQALLK